MKESVYAENIFKIAIGMDMIIIATGPYWVAALHSSVVQCSQTSAIRSPILHWKFAPTLLPAHFRETWPVAKYFTLRKIRNEKKNQNKTMLLIFGSLISPPPSASVFISSLH